MERKVHFVSHSIFRHFPFYFLPLSIFDILSHLVDSFKCELVGIVCLFYAFFALCLDSLFQLLFRYLKAEQALNQKVRGDCCCKDYLDYIYVDAIGELIKPNFVTHNFDLLLKKQGLKKIRFHDLRHSCASLLYANGVPLKDIQEWLGMTSNIYTHLDYSNKVSSANAIMSAYPSTILLGAIEQ